MQFHFCFSISKEHITTYKGASVAIDLSTPVYRLATKLNESFNTDRFVVFNAVFGGGKQPQQFSLLMYLDLLGFKPDIIINYDDFNNLAMPSAWNIAEGQNAIYRQKFVVNKTLTCRSESLQSGYM